MKRKDGSGENESCRTRPLVWVRRIVLYETVEPIAPIREINFSTGLNIIQGESNEKEELFESGHGIGKTTLCRLIRYCLGEKSFGQKHIAEEIKYCFPHAHVGAVIELDGTDWTVLRPLGHRGRDHALESGNLDGLIRTDAPKHYDVFVQQLTSLVLAEVPVSESLTSGQTLQWLHVLAMCSRDQESRYDRFWNWRHTRSESGTPKFTKPKVDAGLCVRAVVGLLDPAEPKLRSQLEQSEASLEKLRAEIKEKKAEPTFHITRLRKSLANDCGVWGATDAPLDDENLVGLPAVTRSRLEALKQEIARIEEQLVPLDRRINVTAASLLEPAELAEQTDSASNVTNEGSDTLLADLEQLRTTRRVIRDAEAALCKYGRVLIGECSYVKNQVAQIDNDLRARQQAVLPTISERDQAAARLAEQTERLRSNVTRIQQQLDAMNRQKNDLVEQRRNLSEQLRRIPLALHELRDWHSVLEGTMPNTAIQTLEQNLANTEMDINSAKINLAALITAQENHAKLFESRFDGVVKRTLTKDFKGIVEIDEEGIELRIKRGESLSGEAYETLAVLLADVALLFESNAAHAHHPGFLIHDSPREADLNLRIYQRLLDMADSQMRELDQNGDIPFQYIVTTTTLPSQELQARSVTKVTLSGGIGSLFGRQLEAPVLAPQPNLFEGKGDA